MTTSYTLHHGDCLDVLRTLPDASVDAVITDPPYGYKAASWDTPIDIEAFTRHIRRVLKTTGFYAFFGQMPSIAGWHCAAAAEKFHFCEDIVWVKRNCTPMHRLKRGKESIFIYAHGKRKQFYCTTGPYEDVKLPGVLVDIITLEAIDRHIKDLRLKAEGRGSPIRKRGASTPFGTDGKKLASLTTSDRSPEFANFTNVWSFLPGKQSTRNGKLPEHPTQKPIVIMQRLCEMLIPEGGTVLDPFAGSGSTGVAAMAEGRSFIGIEKDAGYFAIAEKRLADAAMQQRMALEDAPLTPCTSVLQ